MSLLSVVSVIPAGKKTGEHTVPLWLLTAPLDGPPTHYGYHGWEPIPPVGKAEELLAVRPDVWTKENIDKQPIPPAEKTGLDSFTQMLAAQGLQKAPPIDYAKALQDEIKAKADARIAALPATGSYYFQNDDGSISLFKNGELQTTFDPNNKGPDQDAFRAWTEMGGVPR